MEDIHNVEILLEFTVKAIGDVAGKNHLGGGEPLYKCLEEGTKKRRS